MNMEQLVCREKQGRRGRREDRIGSEMELMWGMELQPRDPFVLLRLSCASCNWTPRICQVLTINSR